jgi:hypothetical protein
MFPISEGGVSNLRYGCVQGSADAGADAIKLTDFSNTAWHSGASRIVKVSGVAGSPTLSVLSGAINIAGTNSGATTGDENRSVEAGFNKLPAGSYIINETGTGAGGTITINQNVVKAGNFTLQIENGPGRTIADAVVTASTTVTSPTANFVGNAGTNISSDVGKSIVGSGIPLGATITAVNSATSITISSAATAEVGPQTITVASSTRNSTQRIVMDGQVNVGNTLTSATAEFQQTDIGLLVKGTGLPANAFITAVGSPTSVTLSAAATKAGAGIVTTIGSPSPTAPVKDGVDLVATLQTEIILAPTLVAGVPDCSANFAAGTDISGTWYGPSKIALKGVGLFFGDSFQGLGNKAEQPSNPLSTEPIIGQILFKTPVVSFAGYVHEGATGGAEIVFPFLPTGLGQCANTDVASVFQFAADMQSQFVAPSGYGKPGTAGFRRTQALDSAGTTVSATASYDANLAGQTSIGPVGVAFHKTAKTITVPSTAGLSESQVIRCSGAACVADGFKESTAYYVHVVDGTTLQLSSTPFGGPAIFVPATVKVDDNSGTNSLNFNTFSHVAGPFTSASCGVQRLAPMSNDTTAFPCSAG